ncbi:unnamed protein product [Vicia faba]|uniref:PUM-HD domain-containing protein n=1 Tax=Vicia faba TaxID=3906 RepID=A0AAV1A2I5_VICFA|nr:unnamed protein product [Vicia faba]
MEEINPISTGFFTSGSNIWNNDYGSLPYEGYSVMEMASMRVLTPPWRGCMVSMAMDCLDCQYLQEVIEEGDPTYVAMILSEIKDYLHQLMKHQFGNYLIQKIFEAKKGITNIQIDSIIYLIIYDTHKLTDVCKNNHGTRVMQIMLENMKCPVTKYAVLYMMKPIIDELMKNINGGYVIVQCVKVFPPTLKKVILDELAKYCVEIATHKIGGSVLQTCLKDSEILAMGLITSIISNAMLLVEDCYGNVVEDLMKCSNQDDVNAIVEELIRSTDFLNVIQEPYGNYVAQRALKCTKGYLRRKLSFTIRSYRIELQNHPHGKIVLDNAKSSKR